MVDITVAKMLRFASVLYGERVYTSNKPKFKAMQVMNMTRAGKGNIEERTWSLDQVLSGMISGLGIADEFKHLNPENFEKFIAFIFQSMGYTTQVTQYTGDYGADVIAEKEGEKLAVQVKKYKKGNDVSNDEVRKAIGSMPHFKATGAVLITTSDYTLQAREQAKNAPIELINGDQLDALIYKHLLEPKLKQLKEGDFIPPDIFNFKGYRLAVKPEKFGKVKYEIILG